MMPIYYIAMPKDEASAILYDMDATDEDTKKLNERYTVLHVIVASAVDSDQTLKVISEKLETDYSEQFARAEVIGTADGYTFYAIPERDEQKISAFDEEYRAEYDKLQQELFAANEITVVNCWGLWCGNCMNEMAELKEFHDKIQEKAAESSVLSMNMSGMMR